MMSTSHENQSSESFDRSVSDQNNLLPTFDEASSAVIEVRVPEILFDLIPKYLDNRRKETIALSEAVKTLDFASIKSIGHKLKGNAGSYGFTYLTQLGALFESAAAKGDLKQVEQALILYQSYLSRVKPVPEA